jgi:hypothetical protein
MIPSSQFWSLNHVAPADFNSTPFASIAKMPRFGAASIALYLLTPRPKMPDMNLTRTEADDLAAFITTLQ